ncbi:MAG: O-antigen ligase family protein, partial [Steroidobacter sp.]
MSLTGIAFALAFFAGLGMAFARHPVYGLYTYVAVFYLHPPSRWWGASLPDLRWSLLAAAVTLIATMGLSRDESRAPWYSTTPAKILIVFTVWVWLQSFWALSPEQHRELAILYTKYLLLFYLIYRLIETPEQLRTFLLVNLAGCAYLGWLGYSTPVSGRLEGVGGPGINEANALAMQLGTAVMMGAMMVLSERKWRLWFALGAMPFIVNTIVLAGSRGAFLAIVVGGAVLWYLKPWAHRRLFYGLAALGLVLVGMLAHETFWERMGTMKAGVNEAEQMDTSAESRIALVKAQWAMAKRYPLGTGHRGTEVLSPMYLDQKYMSRITNPSDTGRRSSHNTFMSALVEQGIPGAVLFIALWLWWVKAVFRIKKMSRSLSPSLGALCAGVAAAFAVVLVAGLFVDYLKAEVQIWLLILLTCLLHFAQVEIAAPQTSKELAPGPRSSVA